MKELLYIFLGGGVGSVLRYSTGKYLFPIFNNALVGTFTANFMACLILGFFSNLIIEKSISDATIRPLILIGLCGGFSTFSTFSFEILDLFKNGAFLNLGIYISLSLVVCTFGILGGVYLSKFFF